MKIIGQKHEIEALKASSNFDFSKVEIEIIMMGKITDEELDAWKITDPAQRKFLKKEYAKHPRDFFPNPICALH